MQDITGGSLGNRKNPGRGEKALLFLCMVNTTDKEVFNKCYSKLIGRKCKGIWNRVNK
jgi:hypothetical protein